MRTCVATLMTLLMLVSASQAALVADWKINEGSGLTLADASGNGNTATANWSARGWSNDGSKVPVNATLDAPSDGQCISLQSTEAIALAAGDNAQINSTFAGPFTVFVRAATEFGASWALTKGNLSLGTVAEWNNWNWFAASVNGSTIADGKTAVTGGTPVDLAMTWDPTAQTLVIYVNGELKNMWLAPGVSFDNTSPLMIVREDRAGSNAVWIESARLYNTALNPEEVLALSTPEPMTLALLAMGGVAAIRRR